MPVLSHLHHLFNAEQCQAYIHTLRWKDRQQNLENLRRNGYIPIRRTSPSMPCP